MSKIKMTDLIELIKETVRPVSFMMPAKSVDLAKWSVVACDQFGRKYWEAARSAIGDYPSTINLIIPESELPDLDLDSKTSAIAKVMEEYIKGEVLVEHSTPSFIYTRRTLSNGKIREGITVMIDLENYDYNGGHKFFRPSEDTMRNKLEARIAVRDKALLEFSHVMMLLDDIGHTVIEPLISDLGKAAKLADFDLMSGGGHIEAYALNEPEVIEKFYVSLAMLISGQSDAVLALSGDGNHSLAAAYEHWQRIKASQSDWTAHPARFAMVELVNLYDNGLEVEPIHRVVHDAPCFFLEQLGKLSEEKGGTFKYELKNSYEEMISCLGKHDSGHFIGVSHCSDAGKLEYGIIRLSKINTLAVGSLQILLDEYAAISGIKQSYPHDEEEVGSASRNKGVYGFYLPPFDKSLLFPTVSEHGKVCRKAFSLGTSTEQQTGKNYYLFARRIK